VIQTESLPKLHTMHEQNERGRDAGALNTDTFRRRVVAMAPLLKRAEELGVSGWG